MRTNTSRALIAVGVLAASLPSSPRVRAAGPASGDWPMWGGSAERNMVSAMKGGPTTWDIEKKANVAWMATLGSQSYGNPVIAGGKVFVGTNNEGLRDPNQKGDRGVLMAFSEKDGAFLWQHTHEKLASGRVNDWPFQGVASSPLVEGDRLYYVSNRCELIALDAEGFRDAGENDGPFKEEKLTGPNDADVLWKLDLIDELGVFPHNLANSSPVAHGDLIYISTSNGQDESHVHIPSPRSPAIVAVNKNTGKVVWEDASPGDKILHGQWAQITLAELGGVLQAIHPQGDGWVRSYDAATGKKLWEFDTNPPETVWPKTRNELIATPVAYDGLVYLGNGQDPEHGEGPGHFYAIDPTKRGDITQTGRVWHYDKIRRTISTAAIQDGIVYVADYSGFMHALDAKTGQVYWTHDMLAAVWASPLLVGDKIYLGDEDGDVVVFATGKEKKVLAENTLGSSVYASAVPANGRLYIMNRNQLWALEEKR
jgi:outer membrane protein assembly factor BamB